MGIGWVKIHRELMDDDDYFSESFSRTMAWIDLILLANFLPGMVRKRGIPVSLKRGDVGQSQEELAFRWKWSRGKVIRFLTELQMRKWIVLQGNNVTTCITIVDYDKYQSDSTTDDTAYDENSISKQYILKEVKNKEVKNIGEPAAPIPEIPIIPKKEKTERKKKVSSGHHLFKNSPYFDKTNLSLGLFGTKYQDADIDFYHEGMENWSSGKGNMRSDWLAVARTFMGKDMEDGKFRKKLTVNATTQQTAREAQDEKLLSQFDPH